MDIKEKSVEEKKWVVVKVLFARHQPRVLFPDALS